MSLLLLVNFFNYTHRPFATGMASSVYVHASRYLILKYTEDAIQVEKGL